MNRLKHLTLLVLMLFLSLLSAHGGRTDKYGGHWNRKTGSYHYHNSGYVHSADNPYQDHSGCTHVGGGSYKATITPDQQPLFKTNVTDKDKFVVIQSCLNLLGYDVGTVDGKIGEKTKSAIAQFQEDNELYVTGELDDNTIETIMSKVTKRIINGK